jgi:type II secretory pathway pseudopilin PulG
LYRKDFVEEEKVMTGLIDTIRIKTLSRQWRAFTMVELMVAFAIIVVAMMGLLMTFLSSNNLGEATSQEISAGNSIAERSDEMRSTIKIYTSQSPLTVGADLYTGLDAMIQQYTNFNTFTANGEELKDAAGNPATGTITLYLNENRVPVELGGDGAAASAVVEGDRTYGPLDIDGDGNFDDKSIPTNGVYDVEMVPAEVSITWVGKNGEMASRRFVMLARTAEQ